MGARIAAVIFDMDGVLADTEPIHFEALHSLLNEHGHDMTEQDNRQILGTTLEHTWRWLRQRFKLEGSLEAWKGRYSDRVVALMEERAVTATGLHDLLYRIRSLNVGLALASSSERRWVETLLRKLEAAWFFSVIVTGEEVLHGKPDPEIYLRTAELLEICPSQCLVIEDSPAGIAAAKAAGMKAVAVLTPTTMGLDLSRADRVIPSLESFDYGMLQ